MSLGIAVKGSEGIVLAADSRITLFVQAQPQPGVPAATAVSNFDNATKLLRINQQDHVGAVTYGIGAMMTAKGPRTMHSFVPEFEARLAADGVGRLPVDEFSNRLSNFYLERWQTLHTGAASAENVEFIVGGYDEGAAYGRVFQFRIPNAPLPAEVNAGDGEFGITWGGQGELAQRLLLGYDGGVLPLLQRELGLNQDQMNELAQKLRAHGASIPFQFLPLQDCVDIATFLIEGTIEFQRFTTGLRGVGGSVDVAIITTPKGFDWVARKSVTTHARIDSGDAQ